MTQRNLFVTTALPYANGAFHMGHIMEYIQADIWVRHERMAGNRVSPKLFTKMQSTVDDVMDLVGLPLLGLVPEDASVVLAAASGRLLIDFTEQGAAKACRNLALRREGRRVALMKLK